MITSLHATWRGCSNLTSFPSIDVGKCNLFENTWRQCTNLTDFSPFSNTTYTSALWEETWSETPISVTRLDNPFTNLGAAENIPVGSTAATTSTGTAYAWMDNFKNVFPSSATYLPRFSIGTQTNVIIPIENPASATLSDGIDIVGWENTNFKGNNKVVTTIPVSSGLNIHLPTLTRTDYDNIHQKLYQKAQNGYLLVGDDKLQGDFGLSQWSTSPSYRGALVNSGWAFTDGNSYNTSVQTQGVYGPHYYIPAAGGTYTIDLSQWSLATDIASWNSYDTSQPHQGTNGSAQSGIVQNGQSGTALLTLNVDWTYARTGTLNGVNGTKFFTLAIRKDGAAPTAYIWFVIGTPAGWVKTTPN